MKIKFDQPHFNGFTQFGIGDVVETDNAGGQYCIELGIAHEVPIETFCKKGEFVQEQYINCTTPNPNWFAKQTALQSNKKK